MALIDCTKCGKEVSDGSPYCPNCGEPVPRRLAPFEMDPRILCVRRWKIARNGFLGIFCFILLYGLTGVFLSTHRVSSATPILVFLSLVGWVMTSLQLKRIRSELDSR